MRRRAAASLASHFRFSPFLLSFFFFFSLRSKLLFNLFPDKVDLKPVILAKKMNVFEAIQNHNFALASARKVGCKV